MFLGEVLSVFHFFGGPLASWCVLGYLLGFALLVINSYLSKKTKKKGSFMSTHHSSMY